MPVPVRNFGYAVAKAYAGHTGTLCADLHRFAFLLGASDGDDLFGEPAP